MSPCITPCCITPCCITPRPCGTTRPECTSAVARIVRPRCGLRHTHTHTRDAACTHLREPGSGRYTTTDHQSHKRERARARGRRVPYSPPHTCQALRTARAAPAGDSISAEGDVGVGASRAQVRPHQPPIQADASPSSPSCTSIERSFSETSSVTDASYEPSSFRRSRKGCDLTKRGRLSRDISM